MAFMSLELKPNKMVKNMWKLLLNSRLYLKQLPRMLMFMTVALDAKDIGFVESGVGSDF